LFATTHWSVVLAAGQGSDTQASTALEELCCTYWYPLYAYVRRRGYKPEDAEDLTQGFLLQLLEHKSFAKADPNRGRFRSFLLAGLNYFLADEHARASAQKRGGGHTMVFLDANSAEERYRLEPMELTDAEKLFERRWAVTLLDRVLERLEKEFTEAGKSRLFERLREFLLGDRASATYQATADTLGMTEGAVKVAVHRMRQRYRELFQDEIAQTVADPAEIEGEVRHVFAVLSR
jgi:RNA polymerase sigma-70 factor (ECF subfamily)